MSPAESFKINLNQNLWGLVVSFTALGLAEHLCLEQLKSLAYITSVVMVVSMVLTTAVYTWRYIKLKIER